MGPQRSRLAEGHELEVDKAAVRPSFDRLDVDFAAREGRRRRKGDVVCVRTVELVDAEQRGGVVQVVADEPSSEEVGAHEIVLGLRDHLAPSVPVGLVQVDGHDPLPLGTVICQ